jgi:DNA-binding response OmpR family regulator
VFTSVINVGDLEINLLHRRVRIDGRDLHLTALELSLLCLLAANAGRVLTRDEILDHVWGADYAAASNVVDRHVHTLRTKLRDDWRRPRYIATVPARGYRFMLPADHAPGGPPDAPPRGAPRAPGRERTSPW